MIKVCYKWGNASVLWKGADWLWSECQLIEEILAAGREGVDAMTLVQPWLDEPWSPHRAGEPKKKRLIRLICKVKGIEFDEEKMMKDFKVTAKDIKLIVKTVSGVDLDLKLEE